MITVKNFLFRQFYKNDIVYTRSDINVKEQEIEIRFVFILVLGVIS